MGKMPGFFVVTSKTEYEVVKKGHWILSSHSFIEILSFNFLRFFSVRNRKFWDFTVWFGTQPRGGGADDDTFSAQAPNIFQARLGEEGQVEGQILGPLDAIARIGDSAHIVFVLMKIIYIFSGSCCQFD